MAHLEAAGHACKVEHREGHKRADIRCRWHDALHGDRTLLVETKHYTDTLQLPLCTEFVAQYGALVNGRTPQADVAWLVSRGEITPDARALVEATPGLYCFTYFEFLRRISGLEHFLGGYLLEADRPLSAPYLPSKTIDGRDLRARVLRWLDMDSEPPLLILGAYGVGKSTFARHLAQDLGHLAKAESARRVPIYVPLGEVFDEQSASGLFGRLLADRYRAPGYTYPLLQQLNQEGALLLIFDGLDEMADAMTPQRFERNLRRLLELDLGKAKIVLLGRPTVFHSEAEYDRFVRAEVTTPSGTTVASRTRRPFKLLEMRGFTRAEARGYIREYFPMLAKRSPSCSRKSKRWVDGRIAELVSPTMGDIIERPVHIGMLCDIATRPEVSLDGLSRHRLYDTFIQHLVERESIRPSRREAFGVDVRRSFNCELAWWAWNNDDSAGSIAFAAIPASLCESATNGVDHEYEPEELKRELVAGCLVDSGGDRAYFRHRSIQEFLVAEYVLNVLQYDEDEARQVSVFRDFVRRANVDVLGFVADRLRQQEWPDKLVNQILKIFAAWRGEPMPTIVVDLVRRIIEGRQSIDVRRKVRKRKKKEVARTLREGVAQRSSPSTERAERPAWPGYNPYAGSWEFLLAHFVEVRAVECRFGSTSFPDLWRRFLRCRGPARLAATVLWSRSIFEDGCRDRLALLGLLCAVLSEDALADAKVGDADAALELASECLATEGPAGELNIEINLEMLSRLGADGLALEIPSPDPTRAMFPVMRVALADLLATFRLLGASPEYVLAVEDFFVARRYRRRRTNVSGQI